jgi:hypothetical protein
MGSGETRIAGNAKIATVDFSRYYHFYSQEMIVII